VSLSASERAALPAPPPPVRVSQRLLEDRNRVRSLQAAGRLAGVPIHTSAAECVPLLPMARQLNWRMALDEYAVGLDGRLSIREVEELLGNRWRLRQEGAAKERLVELNSERNALYRAFDTEYGRVGHSRGVDGAVAYLKGKYATMNNAKAVLARLRSDYPSVKTV